MKITGIKQQLKRTDRYAISVDGSYAFSLGELELINSGLKNGQELTKDELAKLKDRAKLDKAYDRALNLIAMRPRSEWEIQDYLKRKKYEPEDIVTTQDKLRRSGYLNDENFARSWVANRRLLKAISKRRLLQELRQKRIPDDIIDRVLMEDETEEKAVLKQLVIKKRQQSRYQDDLKLMQYLARQGYSYADIKEVLGAEED